MLLEEEPKTGYDSNNLDLLKIQKAGPQMPKFYPVQSKEFFKETVSINVPVYASTLFAWSCIAPSGVQFWPCPSASELRKMIGSRNFREFQKRFFTPLFAYILEEEQLTRKLRNILRMLPGVEE